MRQGQAIAIRNDAERMVEAIAIALNVAGSPTDELHGSLERGVATSHPLALREAQCIEEHGLEVGNGRFTDADLGDGRGLHDDDLRGSVQLLVEVTGAHPPSCSSP